jgi:phosphomannomutase/phosphomannomutase/phosphoglucomutase
MMNTPTCFKAYDIRGQLPNELNTTIAYQIARAYAQTIRPQRIIIGRDNRLSSHELALAVIEGLQDSGVDVFDIGLCGTEQVYYATFAYQHNNLAMDGGIMITASHNPKDYNGMKLVRDNSKPLNSIDLNDIAQLVADNTFDAPTTWRGQYNSIDINPDYIQHILSYINTSQLKPLKVIVNAGHGMAGHVIDNLEKYLPSIEFIKLYHQPDGEFPQGIPNPLLIENRTSTIEAIQQYQADLAIAWDGDFDRCFLFDENGRFIEGYYIVGLLAEAFLLKNNNEKIIYEPRLTWNTLDIVKQLSANAIQSKTGHGFIKEKMRLENAVYGGEMSAHHYFRDFAYCDSGMIPWLLVIALMSSRNKTLAQLVDARITLFPASGEINRTINNSSEVLIAVQQYYSDLAILIDFTDGLSMEFEQWRFNLRCSNTEPLMRLNVETRGNRALLQQKTDELLELMALYSK